MSPAALAEDLLDIQFESGLPGFPHARRFVLVRVDDESPFAILRCLEEPAPEFVVVQPGVFFPDYAPELDDQTAASIELTGADDALVLVVVNVGDGIAQATANLLGPIVINRHTRRAVQAILTGSAYQPRTALLSA